MKNAARSDVDGLRLDQARSGRSEDAGPATLPPARTSTSPRGGLTGGNAPDRSAHQQHQRASAGRRHLGVEDGTPVWLGDALLGYRGRRKRREPTMASLRLRDLGRVFRDRYGGVLPDDDAGREDLVIALHHLALLPPGASRAKALHSYIELWAPWMPDEEAQRLVAEVLDKPRRWKADTLAALVGLTMADRDRLGITTIGAIDCDKEQREARRQEIARNRAKARRLTAGATPRELSASRQQPWTQTGNIAPYVGASRQARSR